MEEQIPPIIPQTPQKANENSPIIINQEDTASKMSPVKKDVKFDKPMNQDDSPSPQIAKVLSGLSAVTEHKTEEEDFGDADNKKLAEFVKAHGFCLACMSCCHQDHYVHELYHKFNFRCDCGNSRMPMPCQLESEEAPKDYENEKNRYADTFFDIYCHCKTEYGDQLQPGTFMQ